jgi:hypothetical protein
LRKGYVLYCRHIEIVLKKKKRKNQAAKFHTKKLCQASSRGGYVPPLKAHSVILSRIQPVAFCHSVILPFWQLRGHLSKSGKERNLISAVGELV